MSPSFDPVDVAAEAPPWLPSWPTSTAPDLTDTSRVQLAVASIREFEWLGELVEASVESWSESLDGPGGAGGGDIRFSVPTDDVSALGTLLVDEADWGAFGPTGEPRLVDRAVFPVVDGQVVAAYVLRSDTRVDTAKGIVSFSGQAPGRLFADRIVGTANRLDMIDGRGHFPGSGTYGSLGWGWSGSSGDIQWADPVRDGRALEVRGDPLTNHLTMLQLVTPRAGETQFVQVFASAFFMLPLDAVDGTEIMSMTVHDADTLARIWPPVGAENEGAVLVTEDMPRGVWLRSPLTAWALTPLPPYRVFVQIAIKPAWETGWTRVDEVTMFRRDTLGTGAVEDLTHHVWLLVWDAQNGRDKASWSLPIVEHDPTGIEEIGHWRHDANQPLQDAIATLTGRRDGPDPPWVGADWTVHVSARRGEVRDDLVLGPDMVVDAPGWTHDAGTQASSVRAETDRGEDWWRVTSVQTDTTLTDGHVIERQLRAPNELSLLAVDQWAGAELEQVSQPQHTRRVLVDWDLGASIAVGDSFRVVDVAGVWRLNEWMRVSQRTFLPGQRLVALDLGSDVAAEVA